MSDQALGTIRYECLVLVRISHFTRIFSLMASTLFHASMILHVFLLFPVRSYAPQVLLLCTFFLIFRSRQAHSAPA